MGARESKRLKVEWLAVTCCPCVANVCPERMFAKASVYMGKGCFLCVAMSLILMCVSSGCLWNLHGNGCCEVMDDHLYVSRSVACGLSPITLMMGPDAVVMLSSQIDARASEKDY